MRAYMTVQQIADCEICKAPIMEDDEFAIINIKYGTFYKCEECR